MNEKLIRVSYPEMDWIQSREKVHRKTCMLYNGIKMNMVRFEKGHSVWMHSHSAEQSLFILEGDCYIEIDGTKYDLTAGSMITVPSWAEHGVTACSDVPVVLVTVFSPVGATPEKPEDVQNKPEPYVFNFAERQWDQVRDKVKRKVYQGSEHFTFSYVQLDSGHEPKPHDHEDIQIVYCVENQTTYYVDGEPYELKPGVVIASAPWIIHNSHNTFGKPVIDFEIFWPKRPNFAEAKPL